jgi:hypothetical protein
LGKEELMLKAFKIQNGKLKSNREQVFSLSCPLEDINPYTLLLSPDTRFAYYTYWFEDKEGYECRRLADNKVLWNHTRPKVREIGYTWDVLGWVGEHNLSYIRFFDTGRLSYDPNPNNTIKTEARVISWNPDKQTTDTLVSFNIPIHSYQYYPEFTKLVVLDNEDWINFYSLDDGSIVRMRNLLSLNGREIMEGTFTKGGNIFYSSNHAPYDEASKKLGRIVRFNLQEKTQIQVYSLPYSTAPPEVSGDERYLCLTEHSQYSPGNIFSYTYYIHPSEGGKRHRIRSFTLLPSLLSFFSYKGEKNAMDVYLFSVTYPTSQRLAYMTQDTVIMPQVLPFSLKKGKKIVYNEYTFR